MEAPAFWTVYPNADREEVARFVEQAAAELGIPVPPIMGDTVAFPPDFDRVHAAFERVDPDWATRGLLMSPRGPRS